MVIIIACLLGGGIVFYALYKNYTIRTGGKALGFDLLLRGPEEDR